MVVWGVRMIVRFGGVVVTLVIVGRGFLGDSWFVSCGVWWGVIVKTCGWGSFRRLLLGSFGVSFDESAWP